MHRGGRAPKEHLSCMHLQNESRHIWIPVHQNRLHARGVERASKYTHVTAALRDGPLYLSQTTIPSTRSRALYVLYLHWSAGAWTRTSPFVEVDLHSESPPRGSHLAIDLAPVSSVTLTNSPHSHPQPAPPRPTRTARSTKRLGHQTLQRFSRPARRAAEAGALPPLRPRWRGLHRELDAHAQAYRRAQRSRQRSRSPRDRPHLLCETLRQRRVERRVGRRCASRGRRCGQGVGGGRRCRAAPRHTVRWLEGSRLCWWRETHCGLCWRRETYGGARSHWP